MALENTIPTLGTRNQFQVDVDDEGILVRDANEKRKTLVMYNKGPDTAWSGTTLETATPDAGFPLLSGGVIIDEDSSSAWYFGTDTGEAADIRGWEVERP